MDSLFATVGLPLALAIIMFGLGLSLTTADFARVAKNPRAAAIALACQLLVLPLVCFGLVLLFALPPVLAVGMMLLAASPGGSVANLFSHLFRGDVALNISLTAINSVIAIFTLPLVVNLAVSYFMPDQAQLGLQFRKTFEVFVIVLTPVGLGMLVRKYQPGFADAMDKPVRFGSIAILCAVILAAALSNWGVIEAHLMGLIGITTAFCLASLGAGYAIPRLLGIGRPQAVATSFEVGLHNGTLAIVVAQSILGSPEMSLPAAIYGVAMLPLAALFGMALTRMHRGNG